MSKPGAESELAEVPLFPLPNVVLFPRAVLPLHIFEERYKEMTADVLEGDRLIAMALLRPGWEKDYYGKPEIERVVCVGEILSCEQLEDGKYNFLLQGRARARIAREHRGRAYRRADLVVLEEKTALEIDLEEQRHRLMNLFSSTKLSGMPTARQFRELLGSALPTADLADLVAFNFLEDVELKQQLLAEIDVRSRVGRVTAALADWTARINPGLSGFPVDPGMN